MSAQHTPAAIWADCGWQACLVVPYSHAIWRGGIFKDWHDAMSAAIAKAKP